ncbi:unnamed protein product [Ceutorhynchus assimilis]|uniref:RAWUL domain-containing protein n=1 Tax=Ceutorhynchus assimilis TaxID=467358 RepID=A0A9N9MSQ6_9CUCU|nr:unnamed protein product [Ceutorhynchus assimilis]
MSRFKEVQNMINATIEPVIRSLTKDKKDSRRSRLDKTLQDIVYKLVPELFFREMFRRKKSYKDYPHIAARVSPEERGEDTERTIFNPQEMISLSLEYICDDSTPGAIRIPGIATDPEKNTGTFDENQDSQMKRYLHCPGMCRIEVLKKFVRNKYNVDTNQFFIDVLYKRVPLPDHYTLIDIAYIYSWQRNELMKFFFRIIDRNKAKKTDGSDSPQPQFIPRHFRRSRGERIKRQSNTNNKKTPRKSCGRASGKLSSQPGIKRETYKDIKTKTEEELEERLRGSDEENARVKMDDASESSLDRKCKSKNEQIIIGINGEDKETDKVISERVDKELKTKVPIPDSFSTTIKSELKSPIIKTEPVSPTTNKKDVDKLIVKVSKKLLDGVIPSMPVYSTPITKSFTSITINRSENVEIITKIEPVSCADGFSTGQHIIKQTIKKGPKKINSPRATIAKKTVRKKASPKKEIKIEEHTNKAPSSEVKNWLKDEKSQFLRYFNLLPKVAFRKETKLSVKKEFSESPSTPKKEFVEPMRPAGGHKRKSSSPIKNEKAKVPKMMIRKTMLQEKPTSSQRSKTLKSDSGLRSLISNCKIPSSLSITIKEGSQGDSSPTIVPPVKNFIEILKLPEDASEKSSSEIKTKFDLSKFCDNDSEQKVDEDLSEIAKSLTEKIPMSTTVSQIVGPKPQFQIPMKTNIPSKVSIQPSPVPELNKALAIPAIENLAKLNPRSPQTFQKIFEESLKKPPDNPKTAAVEVPSATDLTSTPSTSSSNKKNSVDIIASKLSKETKSEEESKDSTTPKVPIPRLSNLLGAPFSSKMVPQTVASLHSTSLGMNYTVSVGQQSPTKVMKSNGIVSPGKAESAPVVPEYKPPVSPLNELKAVKNDFKVPSPSLGSPKLPEVSSSSRSPRPAPSTPRPAPSTPRPAPSTKHSPKSSPLIKHMYAPTMFNQTPVTRPKNTAKLPKLSPKPSPTTPSTSPSPSASASQPNGYNLTPSDIVEKYNIQNLAQISASFNLNPSIIASNQLAAFQQAMLLKHFEMQNRQSWLNRNQGPLLQYEKYLQSLNSSSGHSSRPS